METTGGIQINKYISSSGFCSRREADVLVEQMRVTINGKTALPISRVQPNDKVAIDDETIKPSSKASFYIAFNKPKGITSTTDTKDKTNIVSFINHNKRIFPIGRLDKDTEGLILLTDDGDIVNKILRSENEHEKEYIVTVDKPLTPEFLKKMANGVEILETVTKPCKTYQESTKKFKIILTQGLNRQIRRMCTALGYEVTALKRTRIMHIKLDKIPVGRYRELLPAELKLLNEKLKHSVSSADTSVVKSKSKAHKYSKKTPNFKALAAEKLEIVKKPKALKPRKPKKMGRSGVRKKQ
ncbi:MAG: 23S rRNA pseudouridine(2604) synthase RluF [Bacteroidota bacterium]|nr:23S rRNA pseudouridine(2604) synthase RluF [Bacteroidota bacterium]